MYALSSSLLLPLFASAAVASQCRGSCKTLLRASEKNIPGVLHIDGPSHMVADLSARAGWEMIDCPSTWDRGYVDVRLVCTTEDPEANCHHVHEEGAEHTIVRLPDNCGTGPFARIAQWSVADDQSVPAGSRADRKLRRRNLTPEVFQARLDYNFRAIPVERGTVSFDLSAAHHPDIAYDVKKTGHVARALREATGHPAYQTEATADADHILGIDLPDIDLPDIDLPDVDLPDVDLPDVDLPDIDLPDIDLPDIPDINNFDTIKSNGFEVMNTKFNKSLVDESLSCDFGKIGFSQSAKIGLAADVQINAGYAFKMAGQLVPPEVKDFGVAGAMSGRISTEFSVDMYLSADILFPPLKVFGVGVPGLSVPGIITLGPEAVLQVQFDLVLDVAFAAKIPLTYNFERIDFSFPENLVQNGAAGKASKKTSSLELNASPGDQTGSFGIHLVPKLEFGAEILHDMAHAEVYVGVDLDATFNSNGTIYPDWSYTGCQDFSVGALVKAGVSAGFSFLSVGEYKPLYEKRHTVWSHCSKAEDGPAGPIYDNGDGTFSNAGGDLVNENGELIDEKGEVIPDADAEDAAPAPIKGEDGNPIPEEDIILDNGDGTYDDAQGNPVNADGQRLSPNGTVMACDLDLGAEPMLDADGNVIPPEDIIVEVGDGVYSNSKCELVNEDGQLINADGVVIDFEPFVDETGAEVPASDVVIDMEDGTYMDAYGNPVDQWGGALDFDEEGNVIPVELTPVEEDDGTQLPREEEVTTDPDFKIMTPEELEALALSLINGSAPALPTDSEPEAPSSTSTELPPSTEAPTSTEAPPTDAPTDAPSTETPSSTETSAPEEPTLNPNPIPIPSGVPACKAASRKRSLASRPARPRPTEVSANIRRKRAILGKRSGFGCSMPSIAGLPVTPATAIEDLSRMF